MFSKDRGGNKNSENKNTIWFSATKRLSLGDKWESRFRLLILANFRSFLFHCLFAVPLVQLTAQRKRKSEISSKIALIISQREEKRILVFEKIFVDGCV